MKFPKKTKEIPFIPCQNCKTPAMCNLMKKCADKDKAAKAPGQKPGGPPAMEPDGDEGMA